MAKDMLEIFNTSMLVPLDIFWIVGKGAAVENLRGVSVQYNISK